MRNNALFALALIASAAAITPTVADAAEAVTLTSIVETADLDLASANGQRELDRRIIRAAREVCGEASNVDVEGRNAVRACRDAAVAEASAKREQLFAAAHTGSPILIASAR